MPKLRKSNHDFWGRPINAPPNWNPYKEFQGTALWRTVKKAIADLESNQDLKITEWHQYVVGYICKQLSKNNLVKPAALKKGKRTSSKKKSG